MSHETQCATMAVTGHPAATLISVISVNLDQRDQLQNFTVAVGRHSPYSV